MDATDPSARADSLLQLGRALQHGGYRFTTVSPATHARVNARPGNEWARSMEDVLGWSRPFGPGVLPTGLVDLMQSAGALREHGVGWRSQVRVSTLDGALFFHSAYPTTDSDAVFFGPDTYRFAAAIARHLAAAGPPGRRAVDIGCGAGPGAVLVARAWPDTEVLAVDINDLALRHCRVNAALAGAPNLVASRSDLLANVAGDFDLIVANPPYLLDQAQRVYRHGGGGLGEGLSLAIAGLAGTRLAPGGTLLLYTGSAVCAGVDRFRALVTARLQAAGLAWDYEEIDPDVFGEELIEPAYAAADRIAAVLVSARRGGKAPT
ncbi:methyltransferase [Rubrivivax sp. RP6-9]|uniref:methyltransferase n=1 Tax=Rubrivivax sp. RP6-9 TaxID=3415750 RepID=UPI003CC53FF2